MPNDPIVLTAAQARVLGALVEKEITTPDDYPLSLNALINACNQRSNRLSVRLPASGWSRSPLPLSRTSGGSAQSC